MRKWIGHKGPGLRAERRAGQLLVEMRDGGATQEGGDRQSEKAKSQSVTQPSLISVLPTP